MDRPRRIRSAPGALVASVMLALACTPAGASEPLDPVASAVEDVQGATAYSYGTRDDRGATLDAIKVLQVWPRYVGVYHSPGATSFDLHVATSTDLMTWSRRATLDTDASQGTIAAVPGGGYVVAYEKAFTADVAPALALPPQFAVISGLIGRVRLRFRYYPTLDRLLTARPGRTFTAPRTVALTAEGTPDLTVTSFEKPSRSRIEVGLHHFADTDANGFPDADRQGTGVLTNFAGFKDATAPAVDSLFLGARELHAGFTSPPTGNLGDRDPITVAGQRLVLHEAQYRAGDFGTWRLFLRAAAGGAPRPLAPRTHGGSRAFANPAITALSAPDGRPALFVSTFVPSEGAAPGEAGSLVYYRSE